MTRPTGIEKLNYLTLALSMALVFMSAVVAQAGEWRCIGLEEDSVTFINGKLSGRLLVGASSGMYVYNDTSRHQVISGRHRQHDRCQTVGCHYHDNGLVP